MENKGLDIKSFHRNQKLLDSINLILIHLKLLSTNIHSRVEDDKINLAIQYLVSFLDQLENLVIKVEKRDEDPLIGADIRLRTFAKCFVEAKGRKTKFRSSLFQSSIPLIQGMIQNDLRENSSEIILSLTELRILLEEQISIDSKSIISEI